MTRPPALVALLNAVVSKLRTRSVSASGRPYPSESVMYAAADHVAAEAIAERVQLSEPFANTSSSVRRCSPLEAVRARS